MSKVLHANNNNDDHDDKATAISWDFSENSLEIFSKAF